jgi:GT2 family glycosyltransferase
VTPKPIKIASLACSYNRKDKTGTFLKSLFAQALPEGYTLDIYLLDDNSTDGTAEFVKKEFPAVKVVEGTGSLYWAGGMRTVWNTALKNDDYDFFILLNDDVHLFDNAISRLLAAHKLSGFQQNILLGTVQDDVKKTISYGGHKMRSKITGYVDTVVPDEKELMEAHVGNANIMLVDKATVDKIGILSKEYIHGLADFDYTLVAIKNDVKVWVAPGYYGYCINDHGKGWLSGKTSLKKRIAYLYSPTGLAYKEYMHYAWKHYPLMLPGVFAKAWLKTLFPILYDKFKK